MDATLLQQVPLRFRHQARVVSVDVSAVTYTPEGHLWLGSDELTTVERLSLVRKRSSSKKQNSKKQSNKEQNNKKQEPDFEYSQHQQYALSDYLNLQESHGEVDIEGIDFSAGYLWIVGSHSSKRKRPKGKDPDKDIQRLLEIEKETNRYLLARIPVVNGDLMCEERCSGRFAAQLGKGTGGPAGEADNELIQVLRTDEHIGPFLQLNLPSKENGFDIEALAVKGNRLFLGLRGPVLRGMAIIVEVEVEAAQGVGEMTGKLRLKRLKNNRKYYKHFVDLNGLGIRDLCFQGEDLIVLAGPTMQLSCPMQLFRFRQVMLHQKDTLWTGKHKTLDKLFDLPWSVGVDNAEGVTLLPKTLLDDCLRDEHCLNDELGADECDRTHLLVVYDSPSRKRLKNKGNTLLADVFQLPNQL